MFRNVEDKRQSVESQLYKIENSFTLFETAKIHFAMANFFSYLTPDADAMHADAKNSWHILSDELIFHKVT